VSDYSWGVVPDSYDDWLFRPGDVVWYDGGEVWSGHVHVVACVVRDGIARYVCDTARTDDPFTVSSVSLRQATDRAVFEKAARLYSTQRPRTTWWR
jgi:hypothetical protein